MKKSDWNGPQGSSDMGDCPLKKDDSALGYHQPKSIYDKADRASNVDDGFSGKLPNND